MNTAPVILAILAHPDDAELRCLGTLSKYKSKGYRCICLLACSGENGISIEDKERLSTSYIPANIRLNESKKALESLKIELDYLDFQDGNIFIGRDLIMALERKIRYYSPEIIITHYPDEFYVDHQDHNNVGKATINCASRIEGVKRILLCEPLLTLRAGFVPNYYVDITNYYDEKIRALSYHQSQKGRFYLDEEYQAIKATYYAASVGFSTAQRAAKFESFYQLFAVEE